MRILKYLFLLLLLSLFSFTIFLATQKGDFTVEKIKIINSPRALVYSYVNDTNNWEEWNSWAVEDEGIKVSHSASTTGNGSLYSWDGKDGSGDVTTITTKKNETIFQKMSYNGTLSDVTMSFKDTLGGTKVTWKTIGKMGFAYKILTFFNGGAKSAIGTMFENSLTNLAKKLDYETNTFSAKVDGSVSIPESFYLAQTFTSEFIKVSKNSDIVFPKIINYCQKNNLAISGKPFIIYHTYDTIAKLAKLSFCIPIKDSLFMTHRSDINWGKIEAFQAVKTTLTGDYLHKNKALDKAKNFFVTHNLSPDIKFSQVEIYKIGANETKNPSKWITEIYIPIKPKVVLKKQLPRVQKVEIAPVPDTEKEMPAEF